MPAPATVTVAPQVTGVAIATAIAAGRYATRVAAQGRYAYLGAASLVVVDVADPARPREVGRTASFKSQVAALFVRGTLAFVDLYGPDGTIRVPDPGRGMRIVDVSEPTRPREIGAFDGLGDRDVIVAVSDRYVYALDARGLRAIDVSDPTAPRDVGAYGPAYAPIAVVDDRAYVRGEGAVDVVDITDPSRMQRIAELKIDGLRELGGIAVAGGRLFVASSSVVSRVNSVVSRVAVFDASGPGIPIPLGEYSTFDPPPRLVLGLFHRLRATGRHVYVERANQGIDVLDVSDPRAPSLAGHIAVPAIGVADGQRVYQVVDGTVDIYDAGSPTQWARVGRITL